MRPTARSLALQALYRVRVDQAYSDLALSALLQKASFSSEDKRLATELVYGVLRQTTYLDRHIEYLAARPMNKMEPKVVDALRLGAYQLLLLDRIPPHAAINETVKLAPKRAKGLVNAVLRRLAEGKKPPPLEADPLAKAAVELSHPLWLLDMWAEDYGLEDAVAMARANQTPPPMALRVNSPKANRDDLLKRLAEFGAKPAPFAPGGVIVESTEGLWRHPTFLDGWFVVQSEASQIVSELLGTQPGDRVLDLCAAPGGKTTHLAALVGETGFVLAVDLHQHRLSLIEENVNRLGLTNVKTRQMDAAKKLFFPTAKDFDRVLVDAPCTALGTIGKHPEVRWRVGPEDPERLVELQLAFLINAADAVRPGGALLYSVCTLTKPETIGVVERFLAAQNDFIRIDLHPEFAWRYDRFLSDDGAFLSLPNRTGTEGFFAARFSRKELP